MVVRFYFFHEQLKEIFKATDLTLSLSLAVCYSVHIQQYVLSDNIWDINCSIFIGSLLRTKKKKHETQATL